MGTLENFAELYAAYARILINQESLKTAKTGRTSDKNHGNRRDP